MFSKLLENLLGSFVVEGEVVLSVDAHIVHIDLEPLFCDHISTNVVHEHLKGGGCVGETEEHDRRLKESQGGDKGRLPLVFLS